MPKRPTDTGSIASASGSGIDIRSGIVSALVVRASELHVPTHPWFAGMRVQASDFSDPANPPYLAYREACRIIQRALDALPGDGHGLEQGARQSLAEFGLLGLAMLTAPTLNDALHIGIGFAPITGAMLDLAVEDDPAGGVCQPSCPLVHAATCFAFGVSDTGFSGLSQAVPAGVQFRMGRPRQRSGRAFLACS